MESKQDIYQSFESFVCGLMYYDKFQIERQNELCKYLNKLNYSDFFKIFEILKLSKNRTKHIQVVTNIGECFVSLIYNPNTLITEIDNIDCLKLILNEHDDFTPRGSGQILDIDMMEEWMDENEKEEKYKDKIELFKIYINKHKE